MKKRKLDAKLVRKWTRVLIIAFFVVVVLAVVLAIVGTMSSAGAAGEVVGEVTKEGKPEPLWEWVMKLNNLSGALVGILAVVMIIAAGVVYALDLGGGKQIGLAKEMIIAAISGVVLFMLALFLLREISSLFPPMLLENLTNTPAGSGEGINPYAPGSPYEPGSGAPENIANWYKEFTNPQAPS